MLSLKFRLVGWSWCAYSRCWSNSEKNKTWFQKKSNKWGINVVIQQLGSGIPNYRGSEQELYDVINSINDGE